MGSCSDTAGGGEGIVLETMTTAAIAIVIAVAIITSERIIHFLRCSGFKEGTFAGTGDGGGDSFVAGSDVSNSIMM